MTVEQLGKKLKEMYDNAPRKEQVTWVHLFGIMYAEQIKEVGIREVIEQAMVLHDVQVRPLLTVPDNEAIKQMAMSGVGAAIVSALAIQRELAAGDLIRIPIAGLDLRPELSLVKRTDKQLSRAAQAFCALLHPPAEKEESLFDPE